MHYIVCWSLLLFHSAFIYSPSHSTLSLPSHSTKAQPIRCITRDAVIIGVLPDSCVRDQPKALEPNILTVQGKIQHLSGLVLRGRGHCRQGMMSHCATSKHILQRHGETKHLLMLRGGADTSREGKEGDDLPLQYILTTHADTIQQLVCSHLQTCEPPSCFGIGRQDVQYALS